MLSCPKTKPIRFSIEQKEQIGSVCPGEEQLNISISLISNKGVAMDSLEGKEMKKLAAKNVNNAMSANKLKPGLMLHSRCKNDAC